MPVTDPILTAFDGGELSPRLRGHVTSDIYKKSVKTCLNFEPTPQGSALMVAGTKRAAAAHSTNSVLRQFPRAGSDSYILEIASGRISMFNTGTMAWVDFYQLDLLVNGACDASMPGWTLAGGATLEGNRINLPSVTALAHQKIAILHPGQYNIHFHSSTASGNRRVRVGTTPGGAEYFEYTRAVNTDALGVTMGFDITEAGDVYICFDGNGVSFDDIEFRIDHYGATEIVAPWTTDLSLVQTVPETGRDSMVLVHPNVRPYEFAFDSSWVFQPITLVGAPTEWVGTNWPGTAEISQNRLWLGGCPGQRSKLWGSKVGSLYDFTTGVNESDGIAISVATKGSLRWVREQRGRLLLGTDSGEFSIVGQGTNGAIGAPAAFHIRQESAFGSATTPPAQAGSEVLYVSPDGRKIRALDFSLERDNWSSKDITFTGEHLTLGGLKEVHFAKDPDGTVVGIRNDGALAVCTYDRENGLSAWWKRTTDGAFRAATVLDGPAGSALWLIVSREAGPQLEWVRFGNAVCGTYPVSQDCAYSGASPTGGVLSASWLAGKRVWVYENGVRRSASEVVPTNGQIAVPLDKYIDVGLAVPTPTLVTLPPETGGGRGTTQGTKRRWPRVWLRLIGAAPRVDGELARLDEQVGDYKANTLGTGAGEITITQDVPDRVEVLAVFGSVATSEV